jgi:hypothetical protein
MAPADEMTNHRHIEILDRIEESPQGRFLIRNIVFVSLPAEHTVRLLICLYRKSRERASLLADRN